MPDQFIERLIGTGSRGTFKEALKAANMPFDETKIDGLVRRKIDITVRLAYHVRLFDGALDLLESLMGWVKMALASMNDRQAVKAILEVTSIQRFFEVILTAEDASRHKPDPEIFLRCASELVVEPEFCIVLGDSVFDVEAAKAAGMRCIAVPTGAYSGRELDEVGADLVVGSLTEKKRILEFVFPSGKY